MSKQIELTPENAVLYLIKYLQDGYQKTGVVSLKETPVISRYCRVIKGEEEPKENESKEDLFKVIFQILEVFNHHKAYSLDEATVVQHLIEYIEEHIIKKMETEEN